MDDVPFLGVVKFVFCFEGEGRGDKPGEAWRIGVFVGWVTRDWDMTTQEGEAGIDRGDGGTEKCTGEVGMD